jgi:hypothetical protein
MAVARRPRVSLREGVLAGLASATLLSGQGCSLLLDWNGYTGADVDASLDDAIIEDASSAREASPFDAQSPVDGADAAANAGDDGASGGEAGDAAGAGDAVAPDGGKPMCRTQCGGCCDQSGTCLGGRSATTCGRAGASCADCTSTGQECDAGLCAVSQPAKEGGVVTPTCSQSMCMAQTLCIPYYQAACCKADDTCGCQVLFPPGTCR